MKRSSILAVGVLILAAVGMGPVAAAEAPAGTVMYSLGDVRAYDVDGTARAVRRGDGIAPGERVATGADGRTQLRMRDGGFLALQPNSSFAIERYTFNDVIDGAEEAVFRLLRGGLRAASGLIGRAKRDRYQMRTASATIGIRGTSFKLRVCDGDCPVADGLYVRGGDGLIVVTNEAGEIELGNGQRAYVQAVDVAPQPSLIEPDILDIPRVEESVPEGPVTDTTFIAGQAVFQASISGVDVNRPLGVGAGAASGAGALEGVGRVGSTELNGLSASGAVIGNAALSQAGEELDSLTGSFNAEGGLIGISGERINERGEREAGAIFISNVVDVHTDGILYMGRWTDGSATAFVDGGYSARLDLDKQDSAHYVVGSDEVILPASGTASYVFNGMATASTGSDGSVGRGIVDGQVDVDFGSQSMNSAFTVEHDGRIDVTTSGTLRFDSPTFKSDGSATGAGCATGCAADAQGFVAGSASTPERVGMNYQIDQATRTIVGVGGFSLPGTN